MDSSELAHVLTSLTDYIGIHEPVFDSFGSIVDAQLVWWNDAYRQVRTKPVEMRQSMMQTYFEPHIALSFVDSTWKDGRAFQFFDLPATTRDRYRERNARVAILVNWQRIGDYIIEAGGDLSEFVAMQEVMGNQFSLIAIANKRRVLAEERERIGRNLHDSVIQHLYVGSLTLGMIAKTSEPETATKIQEVVSLINSVISEVRDEILDISTRRSSPLRKLLEDILVQLLMPTAAEFDLSIECGEVDQEIVEHVRAVISEAASNAVRHGGASQVRVLLQRAKENLVLSVDDNGSGIDPLKPLQNGLNNIRDRAISLGGLMELSKSDLGGVHLSWVVPHPGWS